MTRQDDELVRRYHEASEQEGARPGAHVREAVRAHAQMIAKAAARRQRRCINNVKAPLATTTTPDSA